MQIKMPAAAGRGFTARLCVALLLSSSLSPVGAIVTATGAKAEAVCITPESGEDINAIAVGDPAGLLANSQFNPDLNSPTPAGFTRIQDTNGTPTFQLGTLYKVTQTPTGGTEEVVSSSAQLLDNPINVTFRAFPVGDPNNGNFFSTGSASAGEIGISTTGASGAPILSSVEVTNTEVQDLIRQRRELQSEQQVASAETAPATTSQPEAQADSEPPAPAAKNSAKKTKKNVAVAEPEVEPGPIELSLSGETSAEKDRWLSVWAQAFADYERHSNLAPSSGYDLTRKQETVGGITGGDVTYHRMGPYGTETLQLGLLGGGIHIQNRFSDTPTVTDLSQTQDGGFVGAYAAYAVNNFAVDAFFKTDLLRLHQKSTTTGLPTCGKDQVLVVDTEDDLTVKQQNNGSTNEYVYTTGANIYYRFDLGGNVFFEPVAGFLFSATEFGGGAAALGLDDGQMLRFQGGARIGRSWFDETGHVWSLSLLGLLYSDVYVNGYTLPGSGFAVSASEVDEGKLRVLGQLEGSVDLGDGLSLVGQANVRGGEDLFGVGGRFGARLEW